MKTISVKKKFELYCFRFLGLFLGHTAFILGLFLVFTCKEIGRYVLQI